MTFLLQSGKGSGHDSYLPAHLSELNWQGCLEPVKKKDAINNDKKQMAPLAKAPQQLKNGISVH